MSIAGLLVGMSEAHQAKQKTLFEREMDRRDQLANLYLKFALDPTTRPEAMGPMLQRGLAIKSHPPDKKLPKEYEDITPLLTLPPVPPSSEMKATESQGFQPAGQPSPPMTFGDTGTSAPAQLGPQQLPGPQGAFALPSLPGPAAPAMPSVSLPPPPAPPALSARYSPEEQADMTAKAAEAAEAAKFPYQLALAQAAHPQQPHEIGQYGLYIPETGKTILPPAGVQLPVEQQMWNAAAISVAKREKVPGIDWTRPVGNQLSPTYQPAIAQEYEKLKKMPPDEATVALRQIMQQEHELRVDDLKARRGPEAINEWVNQIEADPDAVWDVPMEVKSQVRVRARERGVPVPTRKIPTEKKNQEGTAETTLEAIKALDSLAKQYPNLIGPVAGRLGEAEQAFGTGWRDPNEMMIAQQIRTRMTYLMGMEARVLFGGRAAHQLVETLEKVSANPKQNISLLMGSLGAMKWHAENVLRENMAYRFGGLHTEAGKAAADRIVPSATPPLAKVGETKQVLDPATGATVTYRKGADGVWRRQK